ncbi:hypothetical protein BHH47_00280 [Salmonella enterica]|nr:hypothetical protein [Salmonella enterica]EDD4939562.1 hypothetical protein [Salmonella enterica subsp. enterica serovar Typhimurium]EBB1528195.1 hypothetical protein [Salmonella enterica]EBE7790341.1 hypothetical protein [Salmonella enterica]EBQ7327436.1 hypothetical protein [Salmonella enterica]
MTEEITLTELAKFYGVSQPAVKKWVTERGMPYNTNTRRAPKEKAIEWIKVNILEPLRSTDVREQIQIEKLGKARAERIAAEMDNREKMNTLIPVSYVEAALAGFCGEVKQTILQIPTIHNLEILEAATDPKTLKNKLRDILTERLNAIGDIMLNPAIDQYDEYSEDEGIQQSAEEETEEFDLS